MGRVSDQGQMRERGEGMKESQEEKIERGKQQKG